MDSCQRYGASPLRCHDTIVSMERIPLISDIHGNLPALEAVLADIARRDIARVLCLGDLESRGGRGLEVVDGALQHPAAGYRQLRGISRQFEDGCASPPGEPAVEGLNPLA